MAALFEPLTLRELTIPHRAWLSPMCQYSAVDGVANAWHRSHLGARAIGRAAVVMVEASGVEPAGRITPGCLGVWSDEQADALVPIASFVREQGCVPAIQIAHAGRKASADLPWQGGNALSADQGAWQTVAPSALAYDDGWPVPRELTVEGIDAIVRRFADAAARVRRAGFDVVEIHMAHGYLLHSFLSPLANRRTDAYGGSFENRTRLPLAVAAAVREIWPDELPVFVRISATDWAEGGWDVEQSAAFATLLRQAGIDLIDCSSGGAVPWQLVDAVPGYQVPLAERIRRDGGIATAAVGLITDPHQANEIVEGGRADAVFIGRESLRDPHWPRRAGKALGAHLDGPIQYHRAPI